MKKLPWTTCPHPFKFINVLSVEDSNPPIGQHPIKVVNLHCIQCGREFQRSPILRSMVKKANALGG